MEKVSNKIKSKGNQKISQDPRSIIPQGKKTLILGDSTVKHVEGWWLNKRKKSTVSARCISGATINAMKQFKGCLEDSSPYNIIFHHGTNNLKSNDNSKKKKKKIASDMVNLGLSVKVKRLWYIFQVWLW